MTKNLGLRARLQFPISDRYDLNETWEAEFPTAPEFKAFHDTCVANLYGRTGLSSDQIRVEIDSVAGAKLQATGEGKIKLCLISSPIEGPYSFRDPKSGEIKTAPGKVLRFQSVDRGRRKILFPTDHYDPNNWRDMRIEELKVALKCQPDIICFPEFSFPPPVDPKDKSLYIERTRYGRIFSDFEEEIGKAIDQQNTRLNFANHPFIFMGSFHCPDDYYNTGVVYPHGSSLNDFNALVRLATLGDEEEEVRKIRPPMMHRKRFPARRMGEAARIPSETSFQTYLVKGMQIGVLICSDVVDLNQFMNFVRINLANENKRPVDMILVPAYNNSQKLKSMCRELSFMATTTVAYVNANPSLKESFPPTEIYCCGYDSAGLVVPHEIDGEPVIQDKKITYEKNRKYGISEIIINRKAMNQLIQQFRRFHVQLQPSRRIRAIPRRV